jgi:S1-C subfamily serine protease
MMRHRLLLVALALLLVIALTALVGPQEQTVAPPSYGAIALSNAIADVVERVMPAVVFISAQRVTESIFFRQADIRIGTPALG